TVNWNSGAGFNPIGNPSATFKGVFDGLNHTVNDLNINRPSTDYVGLFSYLQNAKVQNLGLVAGSIKGQNAVGAVAGWNTNGSIVDRVYSTVQVEGLLEDVGGLVGRNISGAIIKNSYSNGSVKGKGSSGGLGTGGLVGANYADSIIENSYATGSVTGISGAAIGGLVGDNAGIIRNSYASGNVIGTAGGGLIGFSLGGQISNSFWNSETSGKAASAGGGTGLSTLQMFDKNYFTGFDFGSVWGNGDNQTTPYLLNLANNQVFNKNDLPSGAITATNRPALYTAILNINQLQNINQNLSGKYLLGNHIDASATASWNGGAGFNPIGNPSATFKGVFDGL
ncbi:MAG: GLUG motif-containing protein, partial [Acinetobacter sp.]